MKKPEKPAEDSLSGHIGAFSMVLAAGFMTLLDVSIVNVALPSMELALGAGADTLQWIVAGYALAFGLTLVAAGRAGDLLGRRRLFLVGLTLFVAASLACGLAPSALWLAIFRFVQGGAAGVLNPQVIALMQELYQGTARAKAFGVFGVIVGLSTALGPVLGGTLIAIAGPSLGWRLVFLMNVPIGMVVIPLAAKWLPVTPRRLKEKGSLAAQFDPIGILLLGGVVVCIMLPFLESSAEAGIDAPRPYWLLGVSAALAVVLAFWERWWVRRGGEVLMDPALLKNPSFMLGVLAAFFYFGGFTSILLVLTLFLQQSAGWSALAAGAAAVPFALTSGVTSGTSGGMVNRLGRSVPVVGTAIVALTLAALGLFLPGVSPVAAPWVVIGALAVAGAGSGLMISPNQTLTLFAVPLRLAGVGAALLQTFQRLGTAIGLTVVTTVYFVTLSSSEFSGEAAGQQAFSTAAVTISSIVALAVLVGIVDLARGHRDRVRASDIIGTGK